MKCKMPMMKMDDMEKSPGRQKMSSGVTTTSDPNSDYGDGDVDDQPALFNDADGVDVGLSRRSPMSHKAAMNTGRGVNSISREKYHGS